MYPIETDVVKRYGVLSDLAVRIDKKAADLQILVQKSSFLHSQG
jgi:hypothetical protein